MKIKISEDFRTAYKRLKKRHKSLEYDFERLLDSLLQDNPRRLLMKREHPDLFRVPPSMKGFPSSSSKRMGSPISLNQEVSAWRHANAVSSFSLLLGSITTNSSPSVATNVSCLMTWQR